MSLSVTDLFLTLAKIPSPTLGEEKVAQKILSLLNEKNIDAALDDYGNVYGKIPATDMKKQPLMVSAHMDVVGDDAPVIIKTSSDGKFYETDKTRTLGADDKAGVAAALSLAFYLAENPQISHGGLEFSFTRDEEQNLTGVQHVDCARFHSEYIFVLDADALGDFLISGAGFTKLLVGVSAPKGGHSGIDIGDTTRINAVKALAELIAAIPQGVYKKGDAGIITSINVGAVSGGGLQYPSAPLSAEKLNRTLAQNAVTNVINTNAFAAYSIRSAEKASETALHDDILKIVKDFNEKYAGKAVATAEFSEHMKPFEAANDTFMENLFKQTASSLGIKPNVASFHAGAETHIFAHKQNAAGKTFKPYLFGAANIYNMHSADERVEIDSLTKGADLLRALFLNFNAQA